ncbi:calcineurin is a calcium-dependent [Colletotrichum plurivorum]|uniref:Calcineurin is a calcium-dependent n=1 Tax=Colletotrichum plurivorum TaxID=2175906 RepID=A0A8H6K418_9PEZI|nr:calcineurin is a calcium-dependent [Colletotrichum plurivorum]
MPPKKATAAAAAPKPLGEGDANRATAPAGSDAAAKVSGHLHSRPKSRKRKSDVADGQDAEVPAPKKKATKKDADPLPDLSGIHLDGDDDMTVPIYDTCDAVRTKIRAILKKDGVTKAAYPPDRADHKIAPNLLTNFMSKKGVGAGNTSSVFYAAYVFFEKLRVRDGKPKNQKRQEMEAEWGPAGFDTEHSTGNTYFTCLQGERPVIDKYGKTRIVPSGGWR